MFGAAPLLPLGQKRASTLLPEGACKRQMTASALVAKVLDAHMVESNDETPAETMDDSETVAAPVPVALTPAQVLAGQVHQHRLHRFASITPREQVGAWWSRPVGASIAQMYH